MWCLQFTPTSVRLAVHVDVDDEAVEAARDKIRIVLQHFLRTK